MRERHQCSEFASPKIDVNINEDKGGAWYIIALVLLIALIAMAGHGRDTTVVK